MAQILTGAKAKVLINNVEVGFIGGLNVNVENTLADVDIIGQLEVGDLAETGHRCNFSINYFKESPVAAEGQAAANPASGEAASAAQNIGIDTSNEGINTMRNQTYFDVEVFDDNENSIFKMESCKLEGGSGQVDARGVWQGTWNFRAKKGYGI